MLYFSLQVMPSALPTGKKATELLKLDAYCKGLIKAVDALIHIDNSLAIWPYEYPALWNPNSWHNQPHSTPWFIKFHIILMCFGSTNFFPCPIPTVWLALTWTTTNLCQVQQYARRCISKQQRSINICYKYHISPPWVSYLACMKTSHYNHLNSSCMTWLRLWLWTNLPKYNLARHSNWSMIAPLEKNKRKTIYKANGPFTWKP